MSLGDLGRLMKADRAWRTPAEFAVLMLLAFHACDDRGGVAWPSKTYIANRLGIHPRSVRKVMCALEKRGLVETSSGGGKKSNRYRLTLAGASQGTTDALEGTGASQGTTDALEGIRPVPSRAPDQYVPRQRSVSAAPPRWRSSYQKPENGGGRTVAGAAATDALLVRLTGGAFKPELEAAAAAARFKASGLAAKK